MIYKKLINNANQFLFLAINAFYYLYIDNYLTNNNYREQKITGDLKKIRK